MIEGNSAGSGGGIYCYSKSSPEITNCTIERNSATISRYGGGGIYSDYDSSPTIMNCLITENTADRGGGIRFNSSSPTVMNCTITGNWGYYAAGGIYCYDTTPIISNCTISGNTTSHTNGGGIYCSISSPSITNCILWNDIPDEIFVSSGSPSVQYSDIQGGWEGEWNIDTDPLFVDPANDDLHLSILSPCIDMGTDVGVYNDIDGDPRPIGYGFDMGSDEVWLEIPVISIFPDYFDLITKFGEEVEDDTLSVFNAGTENLVFSAFSDEEPWLILTGDLGGVLTPGDSANVILQFDTADLEVGEYEETITITSNDSLRPSIDVPVNLFVYSLGPVISIFPDYFDLIAKLGEDMEDETLSVFNSGTEDLVFSVFSDDEQWLILGGDLEGALAPGDSATVVLQFDIADLEAGEFEDTITVTSNDSLQPSIDIPVNLLVFSPGVIHVPEDFSDIQSAIDAAIYGDTVLVADGTYSGSGNKNLNFKGYAITVLSENGSEMTIINCENDGRGFYFSSGEGVDSGLEGFTIKKGYASEGGGIYCYAYSSPIIKNSVIAGNMTSYYGGGIYCRWSSGPTITNCMIALNNAKDSGGGIRCYDGSSPAITNCTITGNTSRDAGGIWSSTSSPVISNCILWDDSPEEIYGSPSVTYSNVQGGFGGTGNIDLDPLFADPSDYNYYLTVLSPCVDAGTDSGVYDDLDGDARPFGDGFDMGADEYLPSGGLEVFLTNNPISVAQGSVLSFTAGALNSGSEDLSFDEVQLYISGPSWTWRRIIFYHGLPIVVTASDQVSTIVSVDVEEDDPLGWYTLTTEIYLDGEKLSSAAFYVEVVDE